MLCGRSVVGREILKHAAVAQKPDATTHFNLTCRLYIYQVPRSFSVHCMPCVSALLTDAASTGM